MSTDTAVLAQQAAALEADLADPGVDTFDQQDTGVLARRGAVRSHVAVVAARVQAGRVELLMMTLHRTCTIRGTSHPSHPLEDHRADAEAGISALFPQAVL